MTYLIAEVGQNHQGSVEVAKDIIRMCSRSSPEDRPDEVHQGVDAVKFTARDLDWEMSRGMANQAYEGAHSFGRTYMEHRLALELEWWEHELLADYARDHGLDYILTICAPTLAPLLERTRAVAVKIASRDATNDRVLNAAAGSGLPVILSTGMSSAMDIEFGLDRLQEGGATDVSLLHCVSEYPTRPPNANLDAITWLRGQYGRSRSVGYSCHVKGTWAAIAAVALGAQIVEKHVTLDRSMRGNDHLGALDRGGVYRWVRDTRHVDVAMRQRGLGAKSGSHTAMARLKRSVGYVRDLQPGHVLTEADLVPLSPGTGIPWRTWRDVAGKVLACGVTQRTLAHPHDFSEAH